VPKRVAPKEFAFQIGYSGDLRSAENREEKLLENRCDNNRIGAQITQALSEFLNARRGRIGPQNLHPG
jgi:hypothetical protein